MEISISTVIFLLVTLIIGRSASAVGRLPPIFFKTFSVGSFHSGIHLHNMCFRIFFALFFCFTLLLWFSLELRSSPTLWLQLYLKNFFSFLVLTQLSFKLCYSTFLLPTNSLSISFSLCPCLTCHIGFFLEIFSILVHFVIAFLAHNFRRACLESPKAGRR